MLDLLIEVEDRLNAFEIYLEKLNFIIQNQLDETEGRINWLRENRKLNTLIESSLERVYMNLDIANDYRHELQGILEEFKEFISQEEKAAEEREEAAANEIQGN